MPTERRTKEDLSKRDVLRCLKRYVAREVFQRMQHPQPVADCTRLRARRQALHLPLRAAPEHFQRPINAIARVENGIVHDADLIRRYDEWLTHQEAA